MRPHDRDLSRSRTCPACGSLNVPLNNEPDLTFCLSAECGADLGTPYQHLYEPAKEKE